MSSNDSHPRDTKSSELARLVGAIAVEDGLYETNLPGLTVARISVPLPKQPVSYKPSLCIIVQGQKQIFLGEKEYNYNPHQYLIVPMAIPLEMEVKTASKDNPVLGLGLELDLTLISELLQRVDDPPAQLPVQERKSQALYVTKMSNNLNDSLIRLFRLLNNPMDLQVLGKSIVREITYWILQSEQGDQIRHLVLQDSVGYKIANLTRYLNENYSKSMKIEDIASAANMSTSALHHRFRDVTNMSPIQYLKKIRLHQARTKMIAEGLNANEAGYQVGYTNPSQLNREFKRMFGLPPGKAAKALSTTV